MFPRTVTTKSGGRSYEYLRLVESYRDNGKTKQRVVAKLGRVDRLEGKLDAVVRKLREYCEETYVTPNEIESDTILPWGPVLVARHLWQKLGLHDIIARRCQTRRLPFDVCETAFVLTANRVCQPASEHALAWWLDATFVCDSKGRRIVPEWRPDKEVTESQRVRVGWSQLHRWYKTLDLLIARKEEIEQDLYVRLRDLFHLKAEMVFYDLTSTYFEGEGLEMLGCLGYSRDGKPGNPQVIVGFVMINGWPITHYVFRGNTADKTTLEAVVHDVEQRFGIRRVVLVSDRGMVTEAGLKYVRSKEGWNYLMGLQRRRNKRVRRRLEAMTGDWLECGDSTEGRGGARVQEVKDSEGDETERYFIVESDERKAYEHEMRQELMRRGGEKLEQVVAAVREGRVQARELIGARAGRAMGKYAGRYYSWEVTPEGEFKYWEDPKKIAQEEAYEGKYILATTNQELKPVDAVTHYKELADIEALIRCSKDVIDMRPVYHQTDNRGMAHILVAHLSLLLVRCLRHELREAKVNLSAEAALQAVKTIGIAELDLLGEKHFLVSRPKGHARRVLDALKIRRVQPPGQ